MTSDSAEIAGDSSNMSSDQLGFMSSLPSDIVLEIFSYLNQQDCLTCMAVCREWYDAIPQYSQQIWERLQLDSSEISRIHCRREKCLGNHVKSVALIGNFDLKDLSTLLQQLVGWGCTHIQSLELKMWCIANEDAFINLMQHLMPCLIRLKLTNCFSNDMPMYIFDACPELTQFICQDCNFFQDDNSSPPLSEASVDKVTKITHLTLDAALNKKQVERILKMCPVLQSFIGASNHLWEERFKKKYTEIALSVDPESIMSWCPKVNFLVTSFCYEQLELLDDDPDAYISNNPGLCYLRTTAHHGLDQVGHLLTQNQQTLGYISIQHINGDIDGWTTLPGSLVLPKLHTMALRGIYFSVASFIVFLNRCPALETIDMGGPLNLYKPIPQPLNTMHRLRTLRWTSFPTSGPGFSIFYITSQCPSLEKLVIFARHEDLRLPTVFTGLEQLKHLEVDGSELGSTSLPETKTAVADFFKYLADNSKLETIRVVKVYVLGYRALLMIATIPTLKSLDIYLDPDLRDEELVEFIQMLRGTAIESITLFHKRSRLPFSVFKVLAELPSLTTFSITMGWSWDAATRISKDGLLHMLSTSPRLTSVSLKYNVTIEEDGDQLARDHASKPISQANEVSGLRRWKFEQSDCFEATLCEYH